VNLLPNVQVAGGKSITDRKQIAELATQFYESLYSDNRSAGDSPDEWRKYLVNKERPGPIKKEEVSAVIRKLKLGRASGPDGIGNDLLKTLGQELSAPLAGLFSAVLSSGCPPIQWCHSEIILIHKKGSKSDINNYRLISLSSCILKIFMIIIKNRCYKQLDSHQKVEQAGFRKKFSTIDHIQALSQLIEKAKEFNIKTALMFIDFNKAFDSLYHDKIWVTLAEQGIDSEVINILEKIYKSCTAQIRLDTKGRIFKIRRGVRQGDPFSPNIFNAVLERVFGQMNWEKKGIKIKTQGSNLFEYTWLNNLRFADDVVLIAKDGKELMEMAESLARASAEVGLTINKSKTNILTNIENLEEITVEGGKN